MNLALAKGSGERQPSGIFLAENEKLQTLNYRTYGQNGERREEKRREEKRR